MQLNSKVALRACVSANTKVYTNHGKYRGTDKKPTLRTFSTGSMHLRNMSIHNSSNLARVMLVLKSTPSNRLSISMVVCAEALRVRFARSQAVLRRRTALGLPEMSFLFLRLNSCSKAYNVLSAEGGRSDVDKRTCCCWSVVDTILGKIFKRDAGRKSFPRKDDHYRSTSCEISRDTNCIQSLLNKINSLKYTL